jgi:hypothetical protein
MCVCVCVCVCVLKPVKIVVDIYVISVLLLCGRVVFLIFVCCCPCCIVVTESLLSIHLIVYVSTLWRIKKAEVESVVRRIGRKF